MAHQDGLITLGRSRIYEWLARLFLERPDSAGLKDLLNLEIISKLEEVIGAEASDSLFWIRSFASGLGEDEVRRAREDYEHLFLVPISGKYVPPYESCFRERSLAGGYGQLWGVSTAQVQNCYSRNGFKLESESSNILPDHIGAELLFMSEMSKMEAELCSEEGPALREQRMEELEFLQKHPQRWIGELAAEITKAKHDSFYSHAAQIAEAFLRNDEDYLRDLVSSE